MALNTSKCNRRMPLRFTMDWCLMKLRRPATRQRRRTRRHSRSPIDPSITWPQIPQDDRKLSQADYLSSNYFSLAATWCHLYVHSLTTADAVICLGSRDALLIFIVYDLLWNSHSKSYMMIKLCNFRWLRVILEVISATENLCTANISRNTAHATHTRLRALGTELIPVSWQSARRWH